MSDLEKEIERLTSEISTDETRMKEMKSALWEKKKVLKSMSNTLALLTGTMKKKEESTLPTVEM